MSIVETRLEPIHGAPNQQRLIFYACKDHTGKWHAYGPMVTRDPAFDLEAHQGVAAAAVAARLAAEEIDALIEEDDDG
jgi:hypothetical protein